MRKHAETIICDCCGAATTRGDGLDPKAAEGWGKVLINSSCGTQVGFHNGAGSTPADACPKCVDGLRAAWGLLAKAAP